MEKIKTYCQSHYSCDKKNNDNFLNEQELNHKHHGKSVKILMCFECREYNKYMNKKYILENKEKCNEYSKNYRQKNKKMLIEKGKLSFKNRSPQTREKKIIQLRKYRRNNLIKCILRSCLKHDVVHKLNNDINEQFIRQLLTNQNKKCFYCKLEVKEIINNNDNKNLQLSIDRIDSNIGHKKDNCVISCLFCNFAKSSSLVEDYTNYIDAVKNINEDISEKYKKIIFDNTWKGKINKRLKTYTRNENISNEFTIEVINEIFKKQNGKDYFTGLPLIPTTIPFFPFKPSMDRLDNSKPHTIDNCVLVCLAGNYGRNNNTIDEYKEHLRILRASLM